MFNPILGILASSGAVAGGSYESIATVSVGSGGQSTIEFTSIPSTYKHLQIRALAKNANTGSVNGTYRVRFNSDSGSNYTYHNLMGDGSSASADGGANTSYIYLYVMAGSSGSVNASTFGVSVMDILDYATTTKNKTLRFLGGQDYNGGGTLTLGSGLWRDTSAISSISFTIDGGHNYTQYTQFALYGIKD